MNSQKQIALLTKQIDSLQDIVNGEIAYIAKWGESNDVGEYDEQWEQYKIQHAFNKKDLKGMIHYRAELLAKCA